LTEIANTITATAEVTADITLDANANLGSVEVTVNADITLTLNATQASGKTIEGAGTTAVTDVEDKLDADLSTVTTAIVTAGVELAGSAQAKSAVSSFIGNFGKAAVAITGVDGGNSEFFNITNAIMGTATFAIDANTTLQADAAKLSGVTVTGGGTVVLSGTKENGDYATVATAIKLAAATLTGSITLADVQNVTLTGAQALIAKITAGGIAKNLESTGVITVIANNEDDLSTLLGVDAIQLAEDASVTMTIAQNDLISTAAGGNTATLSNAGDATGNENVVSYVLANGDQTFTLGAAGQNVTTGTGAVTVSTGAVADITTSAINGAAATTLTVLVAANTDISDAVITQSTAAGTYSINIAENADAIKMTTAQNAKIGTVTDGADATITFTDAAAATGNANIGTYQLANGAQTFTLGAAAQSVTGGTGADTVTMITAATGTIALGEGANVVNVATALDISGATITGGYSLNLVGTDTSVKVAAAQLVNATAGVTESATGTKTVTVVGALMGYTIDAEIDTLVLARETNSVTLGAAGQNVTGGAVNDTITGSIGSDTINAGSGNDTVNGRAGNDIINLGGGFDTYVAGTTINLNGLDSVTGFTFGDSPGSADMIDLDFGVIGGVADLAALRGDGAQVQIVFENSSLIDSAGFLIAGVSLNSQTDVKNFVDTLHGEAAGDILFMLTSTVDNADTGSGMATLYRVDFSAVDTATVTALTNFHDVILNDILPANLTDYSSISFIA
jgi:hypothetical protein